MLWGHVEITISIKKKIYELSEVKVLIRGHVGGLPALSYNVVQATQEHEVTAGLRLTPTCCSTQTESSEQTRWQNKFPCNFNLYKPQQPF